MVEFHCVSSSNTTALSGSSINSGNFAYARLCFRNVRQLHVRTHRERTGSAQDQHRRHGRRAAGERGRAAQATVDRRRQGRRLYAHTGGIHLVQSDGTAIVRTLRRPQSF